VEVFLQRNRTPYRSLLIYAEVMMRRYFFDVENGHRLVDPSGLECRDHKEALSKAATIARRIAIEGPPVSNRKIAVIDDEGREVGTVPIPEVATGKNQETEQRSAHEKSSNGESSAEARGGEA
jgi:hypothetical protein